MRIDDAKPAADRSTQRAFTMVEIALCLGVIGFALVALIGILPLGMQVQKENREETIVSQDGSYWLEAVRNGAKGLEHLTNHVEKLYQVFIDTNRPNALLTNAPFVATNGAQIIGTLSDPTARFNLAAVKPLAGAATENGRNSQVDVGFKYLLRTEVLPCASLEASNMPPALLNAMRANTHELRLTFFYPLLPGDKFGSGRQVLRAFLTGKLAGDTTNGYFLDSSSFVAP